VNDYRVHLVLSIDRSVLTSSQAAGSLSGVTDAARLLAQCWMSAGISEGGRLPASRSTDDLPITEWVSD
jgi:hypothetical protein